MGEAELFARWRPAFKASCVFARLYSYGPYFPGVFGWLGPFRGILLVLSHG